MARKGRSSPQRPCCTFNSVQIRDPIDADLSASIGSSISSGRHRRGPVFELSQGHDRGKHRRPGIGRLLVNRPIAAVALIPQPLVLFGAGAAAGALGQSYNAANLVPDEMLLMSAIHYQAWLGIFSGEAFMAVQTHSADNSAHFVNRLSASEPGILEHNNIQSRCDAVKEFQISQPGEDSHWRKGMRGRAKNVQGHMSVHKMGNL